jgi:hypothetical protein
MEEYLRWMAMVYEQRTGHSVSDDHTIEQAIRILKSQSSRWPREEDFVPMVAVEMAERLDDIFGTSTEEEPVRSFLNLLLRTTDAVRHRVARAAKKRMMHPSPEALDQITSSTLSREVVSQAIANELLSQLSVEEQAILAAHLAGEAMDQVARRLKMSPRTAYRRLREVTARIQRATR